ncbi:MAG: hypothetical protein A2Y38_06355 [Spirochaetes bacterium GWB1_59_5]|nr:MAG: hypothetical protein A2Y38_06355 [Spirochaetes bacterium GWB1_59_5]
MSDSTVTFDFDTTLALSRPNADMVWVHVGPNLPILNELRRRLAAGERVFIVTCRVEANEQLPDRRSVADFLLEHGVQPTGIVFTNGQPKAPFVVALNSELHFDDDPDVGEALPPYIEFRLVNDGLTPRPGTWVPSEGVENG